MVGGGSYGKFCKIKGVVRWKWCYVAVGNGRLRNLLAVLAGTRPLSRVGIDFVLFVFTHAGQVLLTNLESIPIIR